MIIKHRKSSKIEIESYGEKEAKTQAVVVMVKQLPSCSLIIAVEIASYIEKDTVDYWTIQGVLKKKSEKSKAK